MPHAAFRVSVPFSHKDPETGEMIDYAKGDCEAHPVLLADILGSEHAVFGHTVMLEDDHPDIVPYLPEDHPVRQEFSAAVTGGQDTADQPGKASRAKAPPTE